MSQGLLINTSNPGKKKEYTELLKKHGRTVDFSSINLKEIAADPLSVVIHKASQLPEGTLADDTCLDIEGSDDAGINIKWFYKNLDKYEGKKATHVVYICQIINERAYVYRGEVKGTIVPKKGKCITGFGFDNSFLPDGETQTLGIYKPDHLNARALAIQNFIEQHPIFTGFPMKEWTGKWQTETKK